MLSESEQTKQVIRDLLASRANRKAIPYLTEKSFVHPFGSPEFYRDGNVAGHLGFEGEVVEDVAGKDRLIVINFDDGRSFAPAVRLPVITSIEG